VLHEPFTARIGAAFALILVGSVLATRGYRGERGPVARDVRPWRHQRRPGARAQSGARPAAIGGSVEPAEHERLG
jgi:hypothetical protein